MKGRLRKGRERAILAVRPTSGGTLDDVRGARPRRGGYLPVTVSDGRHQIDIVFYDPTRLAQDVEAEIQSSGQFTSPPVVVLPSITRSAIEAAARALAAADFGSVTSW